MTDGMNPADWDALARYVVGESPPEEAERLELRFAAHPADKALLDALSAVTQRMTASVPTDIDIESALRQAKARRSETSTQLLEFRQPTVNARRHVRWRVSLPAIAAAALLAIGVAGYLTMRTRKFELWPSLSDRMIATGVGVLDSLRLPDGTRIVLGPLSSVRIAQGYGVTGREVDVRGYAYFEVVHDLSKPFIVRALHATVQDIGTTFAVRTDMSTGVAVSVSAGSVSLQGTSPNPTGGRGAPGSAIVLNPGERGIVLPDGQAMKQHATPDDMAWLRRQLIFREAPLSEVVASLHRWYGIELRVPDASLAARHLTATFAGEPPERVLEVIRLVLGADIERRGDTAIVTAKR
jgi:transmembrane sensor